PAARAGRMRSFEIMARSRDCLEPLGLIRQDLQVHIAFDHAAQPHQIICEIVIAIRHAAYRGRLLKLLEIGVALNKRAIPALHYIFIERLLHQLNRGPSHALLIAGYVQAAASAVSSGSTAANSCDTASTLWYASISRLISSMPSSGRPATP